MLEPKEHRSYPLLSIAQYLAAILVIMIHCDRIFTSRVCHFTWKTMICRLAVPLFLLTSGYFFRLKMKTDLHYPKIWFKKQIKTYLLWSAIFLPYGFYYLKNVYQLPQIYFLPALFVGIFYLGTCYHLWYFPALLIGMFIVNKLWQKIGQKFTLMFLIILYSFGLLETYSDYLIGTSLARFYTGYQKIFYTPRNGLFYAGLFIGLGFLLADHKKDHFWCRHRVRNLLGSIFFYIIEGIIIFHKQGIDKNFLVVLPVVSVFLFNLLLNFSGEIKFLTADRLRKLRKYGLYYFFLHPIVLELVKYFLPELAKNSVVSIGIIKLISTLILTHFFAGVIIYAKGSLFFGQLKYCYAFLYYNWKVS